VLKTRPLFIGDFLYSGGERGQFVGLDEHGCYVLDFGNSCSHINETCLDWDKPTPKTVLVELPYEFVRERAETGGDTQFIRACIKSFKELK
jgi:hypothetical protein